MFSALRNRGWQGVNVLSIDQVNSLINWYYSNLPKHSFTGFYSTMFFNDSNYRMEAEQAIVAQCGAWIAQHMPDYEILLANYVVKSAQTMQPLQLHADWFYVNEPEFNSFNLWINLSKADEANRMHFVSGSHKWVNDFRFTPYQLPPYYQFMPQLEAHITQADYQAGSGFLYHGALLHGSSANHGSAERVAVNMVLKPKNTAAIHVFKSSSGYVKYSVQKDFFHHLKLDEQPTRGILQESTLTNFNPKCFDENVLKKSLWKSIKSQFTR